MQEMARESLAVVAVAHTVGEPLVALQAEATSAVALVQETARESLAVVAVAHMVATPSTHQRPIPTRALVKMEQKEAWPAVAMTGWVCREADARKAAPLCSCTCHWIACSTAARPAG